MSSLPEIETTPKRVILRVGPLPGQDYEDDGYQDIVKAFLIYCGRWEDGADYSVKHFVHVEPSSASHTWHLVIDMDKAKFSGSGFGQLRHEIYKVKRQQSSL